jgi:hypothetical protein
MDGANLSHTYGAILNTGIKNCVYFHEQQVAKLIYPIGKRLAIKYIEKEKSDDPYEMKYIKLNEEVPIG